MTWYVYVLLNDRAIAYTGIAKDVAARLLQHNTGGGAKFTRGRGPWVLVHQEGPLDHGDALRRELAIKADARFKAKLKLFAAQELVQERPEHGDDEDQAEDEPGDDHQRVT